VTTASGLTIGAITLDNTFTGSVTMSGANTVSGATTISGGTLTLGNATGLGTSAITVNNGGTLAINPGTAASTVANDISGAGLITAQDPAAASGNTLSLSGNYSGFTGTLNILAGGSNNGKVALTNATQANVLSSSATVQVRSGATLYLSNALSYGFSTQLYGTGNSENLGALRIDGATLTGGVTLFANSNIGTNTGTGTISGTIGESGGSFGFTKVGAGTLSLSQANTYTGGTTLSAGTLLFGNNSAFGTGTLTLNGGTLKAGSASNWALANNISVGGSTTIDMAGKNVDFNGNLSGSAALSIAHSGSTASTLTFKGDNSGYSGTVTVSNAGNGNAVAFTSANAGSASAAWVFNDTAGDRVRIGITGGGTINFGSMAGAGQIQNDVLLTTSTISVGALNTSTTFSGSMKNNSTGILALTKVGTGVLTLSGTASTYSGGTTITAGKLNVANASGSGTGSGTVTVSGGTAATLGGTGIITGAGTVSNGSRLAPGTVTSSSNFGSAGTLTLSSTSGLTLTSANLDFDLSTTAGGTNDKITLSGLNAPLSFSTLNFSFSGTTLDTTTAYTLVATNGTGALTAGTLGAITTDFSAVTGGAYAATYSFTTGTGLQVSFTAVPEPNGFALAVVGLLGVMMVIRRRNRQVS